MTTFGSKHEKWIREALALAEKGRLGASPNPLVGACVVRAGVCQGKGFHEKYGGPHAEIRALRNAGKKTKGAALYVTLEPCATWGKTPPCVEAIVRAGIREVVIGALDPNPRNHGKGVAALRREGIRVAAGVLSAAVTRQNESFFKWTKKQLPFVTLKMAQSLDGKIATRNGLSRWISSPASRHFVHRLRAEQDAILIGKNTLFRDNPKLSPRFGRNGRPAEKPWRIVLDPELQASSRARVFQGGQLTFLVASEKTLHKKNGRSHIVLPVPEKRGSLDLKVLLRKLASLGVAKLLAEGGGELAWSLLKEGLVDKAYWIVAPKIIGGRSAKTSAEGEGVHHPAQALPCKIERVSSLGDDWLFEGRF